MDNFRMNRRDAIASMLAISASGALAACGQATPDTGMDNPLRYGRPGKFFTDAEMSNIAAVAETIIPQTDTAGAVAAGVPETIQKLASEWGDDNFRGYWRGGMKALSQALAEGETAFADMDAANRERVLAAYDAKVYDGQVEDAFYRDFKRTAATAYYMSEPGATEELAYEAVPGEWIGCAPIEDYPKTWAT